MTRASLSPSSLRRPEERLLGAGPLEIRLVGEPTPTLELLTNTLSLYDVNWTLTPRRAVTVEIDVVPDTSFEPSRGDYLECAAMLVDKQADGLRATTLRGAAMTGTFDEAGEAWHLVVPRRVETESWWPEIEDLVSLIVTAGWRRAGWVPLHAAGVTRNDSGVLVCASSRGGKTTLTLALARRGWRVLGDDKLVLRDRDGKAEVAAVKQMLNVDPAAREWFPEVGDLGLLPIYSEWSPKRRVQLKSIFPEAPAFVMSPTHVVSLVRSESASRLDVQPMSTEDTISTLLHQTVIPRDRSTARWIASSLARQAERSRGLRVVLPERVYDDPGALDDLEAALS